MTARQIELAGLALQKDWNVANQMKYYVLCDEWWELKWQQHSRSSETNLTHEQTNLNEKQNETAEINHTESNTDQQSQGNSKSVINNEIQESEIDKPQWKKRFKELLDYKTDNGNCNVPKNYWRNHELGTWVDEQRKDYHDWDRKISKERVDTLEKIGFEWMLHPDSNPREVNCWNRRYEQLVAYFKTHHHCFVPREHNNKGLLRWIATQRTQYKKKKANLSSTMTKVKMQRLNEIGFDWVYVERSQKDLLWLERFHELWAFKTKYGHCDLSKKDENQRLARWVCMQRRYYDLRREGEAMPQLSVERIRLLNNIGFTWRIRAKRSDSKRF